MRGVGGLAALTALGALSAAIYAGALPAAASLGVEPLAAHPFVAVLLFALYLAATWLASARLRPGGTALSVILAFGLLFRALVLGRPGPARRRQPVPVPSVGARVGAPS